VSHARRLGAETGEGMLLQRKIEVLYYVMGSYIRGGKRVSIDWLIGCWLTDLWIDHLGALLDWSVLGWEVYKCKVVHRMD